MKTQAYMVALVVLIRLSDALSTLGSGALIRDLGLQKKMLLVRNVFEFVKHYVGEGVFDFPFPRFELNRVTRPVSKPLTSYIILYVTSMVKTDKPLS